MIHGEDLIIYEGADAIAAAKSCTIVTSCDTKEISSPSSATARTFVAGRTGWQVSVSTLVSNVSSALLKVGNTYTLTMGVTGDTLTGTAICTQCQIDGAVGALAKGSFNFLGSGELA